MVDSNEEGGLCVEFSLRNGNQEITPRSSLHSHYNSDQLRHWRTGIKFLRLCEPFALDLGLETYFWRRQP